MKRWIAERRFVCVDRQGKRFRAVARIGEPISHPREGSLSAYGSCDLSMEPLVRERAVGGIDRFQALCLAIDLVRMVLKIFVADGGRVYFERSSTPIDLDSSSFCPLENLSALRKRVARKKRGRQVGRTRGSRSRRG